MDEGDAPRLFPVLYKMIRLRTPFLAAALFTGVAAVGLAPAFAQTASVPAYSTPPPSRALRDGADDARTIRRRAHRVFENRAGRSRRRRRHSGSRSQRQCAGTPRRWHVTITIWQQNRSDKDAVQRLELREQFAKVRADNDARPLTAFKPLYASLSPEQQQMANQLVGAHHHGHHRA